MTTIDNRFGCLRNAYKLIGYRPDGYETRFCRPRGLSDQQLLEDLRKLKQRYGRVTEALLRETTDVPSYGVYYVRFGGLSKALRLMESLPEDGSRKSLENIAGILVFPK